MARDMENIQTAVCDLYEMVDLYGWSDDDSLERRIKAMPKDSPEMRRNLLELVEIVREALGDGS